MVPPRKIAVTHGAPRSSPGSLLLPHRMGLLAGDLLPSHPQVTSSIPRCCHTLSHSSACPRPYGQIDLFGSLKLGFVVFNKSMKLNFLREEFIWSAALKKGHMDMFAYRPRSAVWLLPLNWTIGMPGILVATVIKANLTLSGMRISSSLFLSRNCIEELPYAELIGAGV
uniref:OSJNBa0044K18.16 protein n=1 Tax=Oryza sativa subsp. japonica TaxID=39947 RepID=Q7XK29_ORYSJ|nr:OSJNBa0044K18.16 [Oryza sativa Japonica Group]